MYINHSINFFLYCALTRSFRREVRRMWRRTMHGLSSVCRWCCSYRRLASLLTTTSSGQPAADTPVEHDKACPANGRNIHNQPAAAHPNLDSLLPFLDQQLQQQQQEQQQREREGRDGDRRDSRQLTKKRSSERVLLNHGLYCVGDVCEHHPNVRSQV